VTTLDPQTKETSHRFPTFLPDGDHFLYVTLPARNGKFDLYVGAVSGGPRTHVGSVETAPVYADPGWLLYGRQGGLAAQPFDADALKFTGDPVSLPDEPVSVLDPSKSWTSSNAVSVSRTGVLAYFSSPSINSTVSWSDVTGKIGDALTLPPAHYERVAISPDGARAVLVRSVSASESTLWLVDLARGGGAPLINGHGRNDSPVWSPDGKQIAFANDRDGPQHIYVKTIDDAAPEHRIDSSDAMFQAPSDWSPDGASVVVVRLDPETAHDIWIQPATGGAMKRVVAGPLRDLNGRLSPDGKRLAFHSEDSGRFELYFQSFPAPDRRIPVSTQGSVVSWWTRDSRQLLFVGADLRTIWRANLDAGSAAEPSAAQQLGAFPPGTIGMDAMPDRQRFLVITPERSGIGSATVVLHWQAELDKLR
jgi:dipeptidyl aminopeptidase/acylaminoacyl peptidase